MGRDQGILAYVGHVIRIGGMPYRDAWELKGPTAILPYTLVELVFGRNMWGCRVFDLFMMGANMAAVFFIAREWWDRKAGWYAVVVLALCAVTMEFWMSAQPDTWCGCLIAVAVGLLAGATRSVSVFRFALVGVCIGVCTLQKPVYLVFCLVLLPALVWKWHEHKLWRTFAAISGGYLLPIASIAAWLATHGALGSGIDTFLLFSLRTHAALHVLTGQQQFSSFFFWLRSAPAFSAFMLPAILGGLVLARLKVRSSSSKQLPAILFLLWLLAGLLFVVVQRKYFDYYWYPLLPWMACGAGLALRQGREMLLPIPARWTIKPAVSHVVLLWFAFLYLQLTVHPIRKWVYYRIGRESHDQYEADFAFVNKDYYWFPRVEAITNYVHGRTSPNQSVLVWGFETVINFLSDRLSPTRFDYNYPLVAGATTPYQATYRVEFMRNINVNRPTYIVVADNDENILMPSTSKQTLLHFPELTDFMRAHYVLETNIDDWDIWRFRQ